MAAQRALTGQDSAWIWDCRPWSTASMPGSTLAGLQRPLTCVTVAAWSLRCTTMAPAMTQSPTAGQASQLRVLPERAPAIALAVCQVPLFSADMNGRLTPNVPIAVHVPTAGQASCEMDAPCLEVPGRGRAVPQMPWAWATVNASSSLAWLTALPATTQFPALGHESALRKRSVFSRLLISWALPQIPCLSVTTNACTVEVWSMFPAAAQLPGAGQEIPSHMGNPPCRSAARPGTGKALCQVPCCSLIRSPFRSAAVQSPAAGQEMASG